MKEGPKTSAKAFDGRQTLPKTRCLALFAIAFFALILASSCSRNEPTRVEAVSPTPEPSPAPQAAFNPTPKLPNLQAELLEERNRTTSAPIGNFDFKNYTYELPRGWQNPDGTTEITLTNGKVAPIEKNINDSMPDEAKAEAKAQRRIGLSYVTTRFFDLTGDGEDEAVVVLKVETGGSAIPQLVYIFTWKDGKPELIWPFRTGDRADGGLKNIWSENGELVVELYGKDRFLVGQTETGKITGDEEQLCCPTHFTRTTYKWNGKNFLLGKQRLTLSLADPNAPPEINLGEKLNKAATGEPAKRAKR
jgi:hypothetical protein